MITVESPIPKNPPLLLPLPASSKYYYAFPTMRNGGNSHFPVFFGANA